MERISSYQLFTMTFLYQLGTTIFFGFGASAGRDAWIAILISSLLGSLVIIMYIVLMRMNPGLTLVEWFPAQFGRWVGTPIAWLYPLIFLFDGGRIVGDLRDLIPTTLLPSTPPLVFNGVFLLIIAYGLYLGIENLARAGEIALPIIVLLFIIETILLFYSEVIHFQFLLPVFGNGWSPIWATVYPNGITQTYGETIAFAMIWTQTKNPKQIMKITILSSLISGLFLAVAVTLAITVFDEDLFKRSVYPLYSLLGVVSIGNFINNLSPFGVIYLSVTAFFKTFIKIFAAIRAIQILTSLRDERLLILPAVIIAMALGMTVSKNVAEHIPKLALNIIVPYVWVPLFLILPSILLIVTWIRTKVKKK
ncbi:endospore germination permease [Ammoniphilus sp. 3BR4]